MGKWLIVIGILSFICAVEWIREITTFRVTHYDVKSAKLDGLSRECRIVFLSDLHNNCYGKENEKLLESVSEQEPDLILIGGDMLIGKMDVSPDVAERFVSRLTKIAPVYYANGNHEQRMKIAPEKFGNRYQAYKEKIANSGVVFLENAHTDRMVEACSIRITGLEIPQEGYRKFCKTEVTLHQIEACVGQADSETYQILLAHNPIYAETYLKWGADLVLSGHLHGGVVRVPFLGGIVTPQFRLFPEYSGEMSRVGEQTVIVSKGLGTHTIKVRFLNPAEMIVLHLHGN